MENKNNISLLYLKKLHKQQKLIPLNTKHNSLNKTKYFPSTTREWYNSIYAYNNNNYKNSILINERLTTLIKGYFYMFFNRKLLNFKNRSIRIKRLSLKRIFVGKIELKHTSTKAIITVYTYNEEKRILIRKLLYILRIYLKLLRNKSLSTFNSITAKLLLLDEHKKKVSLIDYLKTIRNIHILKLKDIRNDIYSYKNGIITEKARLNINILLEELQTINNIIIVNKTDKKQFNIYDVIYGKLVRKEFLEKEIKLLSYYKLLLLLNKNKFRINFLNKLKMLLTNLLGKEVELNIVDQKSAHLNSDFFTEAIAIKLRRRKNRLLRVIKAFLRTAKIPRLNKIEKNDFSKIPVVKKVETILYNKNSKRDLLDKLLYNNLLGSTYSGKNIELQVLKALKYKKIAGIRLEAKGRLTKRFTASRSLFKVKWKGSIRNIDSSYKGLSSVILRGNLRSNLQYSLVNSKTRNGAFGLKGWMSGN